VFEKNHFDTLTVRLKLTPDVPHFKDKLQLLQYNKMKMYGKAVPVNWRLTKSLSIFMQGFAILSVW